jgi:membrane-associated phospholipid phosphatase
VRSVRSGRHGGKASAVSAGLAALAGREDLDGVMVLDSDAQHPPERIAAFLAAARSADVVIGNRVARRGAMPLVRRVANATASLALSLRLGCRLPDTQNGMRLYRPDALRRVPLPRGGYDVETSHLRALLEDGRRVSWVPIPTIYNGEPSGFRTLRDSARILRAIARTRDRLAARRPPGAPAPAPSPARALADHLGVWGPRLAASVAVGWLVFAILPVLQPLDDRLFVAINHLGSGPDWLYRAVDPHMRNYALITLLAFVAAAAAHRRARFALGAAAGVFAAGVFANLVMQVVRLWGNRPRPEEVLGAEAWLVAGREWAQLASYPSGHAVVTSAMVVASIAAVPWLRWVLVPYAGVIAATRILFGAHFPTDVVVGAGVGVVAGWFVIGAVRAVGWLPAGADPARILRPAPAPGVPAALPAPNPGGPGA